MTCLTLGTTPGVPGGVVSGECTAFTPAVVEFAPFTNAGTGRTGTVASWSVPATATYRLSASGAAGGYSYLLSSSIINSGGLGATVAGDFALTAGHTIAVMVGQQGGNNPRNDRGGGGGGGTFVVNQTTNTLLLAAGGGGGAGQYTTSFKNALTSANGSAGSNPQAPGSSINNGGVAPNGGGVSPHVGGGAGYSGNGANSTTYNGGGGISYVGGGLGGVGYAGGAPATDFDGGFGGGGGGYAGGGGGGGLSIPPLDGHLV